jgi:formylglycine-generating enzyme required for sulfatase activity
VPARSSPSATRTGTRRCSSSAAVAIEDFWVDSCQVTNDKFARFVADTGYVTVAERPLDPDQFPGAPPENLVQATDWPRRANF